MKKEPMTIEKLGSNIERLDSKMENMGSRIERVEGTVEKLAEKFDKFAESVDKRFNGVDKEIRGLGVLMEDMDNRFAAISEGQDVIREVLETRVAHIEEILEIEATV
jgi:predicted RNase H-like nuclease (RuvC/YqgF family)